MSDDELTAELEALSALGDAAAAVLRWRSADDHIRDQLRRELVSAYEQRDNARGWLAGARAERDGLLAPVMAYLTEPGSVQAQLDLARQIAQGNGTPDTAGLWMKTLCELAVAAAVAAAAGKAA